MRTASFRKAQKQKYSSGTNKLYDQAEATPELAGYSAILPSAWQNLLQADIAYLSEPIRLGARHSFMHSTGRLVANQGLRTLAGLLKARVYNNDRFPL